MQAEINTDTIAISNNTCPANWGFAVTDKDLIGFNPTSGAANCSFKLTNTRTAESITILYTQPAPAALTLAWGATDVNGNAIATGNTSTITVAQVPAQVSLTANDYFTISNNTCPANWNFEGFTQWQMYWSPLSSVGSCSFLVTDSTNNATATVTYTQPAATSANGTVVISSKQRH
jgi:hypothetical protein